MHAPAHGRGDAELSEDVLYNLRRIISEQFGLEIDHKQQPIAVVDHRLQAARTMLRYLQDMQGT
jgi:hypothetical protein